MTGDKLCPFMSGPVVIPGAPKGVVVQPGEMTLQVILSPIACQGKNCMMFLHEKAVCMFQEIWLMSKLSFERAEMYREEKRAGK